MNSFPDVSLCASPGASASFPALERPPCGPASTKGTLNEQWQQALREARTEPVRELLTSQLLCLTSWPDLPHLPPEIVGPVTRICALLWRKHTAGLLIHKVLALSPQDTLVLLTALQQLGHVAIARAAPLGSGPPGAAEPSAPALPPTSLLGKLWQRLKNSD